MNIDDKLQVARAKYLSLIAQKESEIIEIRKKLEVIDEIDGGTEKRSETGNSRQAGFALNDYHRYSKMGLADAALDALKQLIRNQVKDTYKTRVAKYMTDMGFKPTGKNFLISVDTALRRAVEAGKITSSLKDGRRIYGLNPGHELL